MSASRFAHNPDGLPAASLWDGRYFSDLPSTIRVGGVDFEVLLAGPEWRDGENVVGQFSPDTAQITLYGGLPRSRMADVLLHEVHHAVLWACNLDESLRLGNTGPDPGWPEEDLVTRATRAWLAVWRDNPGLYVFITNTKAKLLAGTEE